MFNFFIGHPKFLHTILWKKMLKQENAWISSIKLPSLKQKKYVNVTKCMNFFIVQGRVKHCIFDFLNHVIKRVYKVQSLKKAVDFGCTRWNVGENVASTRHKSSTDAIHSPASRPEYNQHIYSLLQSHTLKEFENLVTFAAVYIFGKCLIFS